MSNFFYGTLPISTITQTTGPGQTNAPGYPNFPIVPAGGYTGLIPNDFLYYYNEIIPDSFFGPTVVPIPVADLCTASNILLFSSTPSYTIPDNCKSFSFFGISGGGGGGGAAGNCNLDITAVGSNNVSGGNGGPGSTGNYMYGYQISVGSYTSISSITIGTGGNAGPGSPNTQKNDNSKNDINFNSEPGTPGGAGNITSFKLGDTLYSTVYSVPSAGGPGGNGGNGANINYNIPSGFNNGPKGNAGTTPTTPAPKIWPSPFPSNINFPSLSPYGNGGPGGFENNNDTGNPGTAGNPGAIQFIWLYD